MVLPSDEPPEVQAALDPEPVTMAGLGNAPGTVVGIDWRVLSVFAGFTLGTWWLLRDRRPSLAALRQEMRGFRDSVREVRTQVDELRKQSSEKNEQVVVLRTQFRILWAVAATAGASGLGALVPDLIRLSKGATP